ncbi:RCC1 domain-containing protein [Aquihabitans daechungensis]|uniref:RCC1 domain-containing protein n=1 Tax=Aquihabitans daechungensis TaxID=1052257 RepID=UPI003B9E1EAF
MQIRRVVAWSAAAMFIALAGGACQPATGVAKPVQAAISTTHGCAVMTDSTVRCWGSNRNGQLGNGTATGNNTTVSTAVVVQGLTDAKAVTVGNYFSCAVRTGGGVSCWGLGSHGRLGNGTNTSSSVPVPVSGITNATSVGAANGSTYPGACASLATGTVKCWGSNLMGLLGVSSIPNTTAGSSNVPVTVSGVANAAEVSVGFEVACARHTSGTATCWGRNLDGVFNDPSLPPGDQNTVRLASPIVGLSGATSIAVGDGNVCAMASGGATCWGSADGSTPHPVGGSLGFTSIVGTGGACGVTPAKQAYCYGPNHFRQIGDPSLPLRDGALFGQPYRVTTPTAVQGLPAAVNSIRGGHGGACAVLANDQIWCWGYNVFGAVGTGTRTTDGNDPGVNPSRVVGI